MQLITKSQHNTTLHIIQTKQFKSRILTIRFFSSLKTGSITARHLMLSMLKAKNTLTKTRKQQSKMLETMYDAMLHSHSYKLGTMHVNQLSMVFIDDKYTIEQTLFTDILKFLHALFYEPAFDEKTLREEKQFLHDYFKAEYTNKNRYAQKQYHKHLLKDYPYNQHAYGDEFAIDNVTLTEIQDAYQTMLKNDKIFVSLVGDFKTDETFKMMEDYLPFKGDVLKEKILYRHPFQTMEAVKETHAVAQDRVFMTFKSNIYFRDDDYFTMLVFNTLFGDGSDSILFKTIREVQGLAYYVHASYSAFTGLITVASGMDKRSIKAGKAMVFECLKAIQTGAFSDEDLQIAKTQLITGIKQSYDHPLSLSVKALRATLFNLPFQETSILDKISAVSRTDIIRVSKRIQAIFTYELGADEHAN